MKDALRLPLPLLLLALSACGGGSGPAAKVNTGEAHYSVGGSVSGLTALSGLTLLDNGGDPLTVAADATSFTFATQLAGGSSYAVTIEKQPSGETCGIANGTGAVNGNVTAVAVTCTSNFASGGANVVTFQVAPGPAADSQTFNIPLVSIRVCASGPGATCATIDNVLIDTGSAGLRLMASVLKSAGLTLPATSDPGNPTDSLYECMQFADGYAWGAVSEATVSVAGETTRALPVQVIDDTGSASAVPTDCSSHGGASKDSVAAFDANGVLGIGVFNQDCGSACASGSGSGVYYSCPPAGDCYPIAMPAGQVSNPVAALPKDNDGVIVQLPTIAAGGAAGASGYLVLGIGTEKNNPLQAATLLRADARGDFTTRFNAQALASSLIDSGSNALYFPDSENPPIGLCAQSGPGSNFYCPADNPPSSPLTLSATNQGADGTLDTVQFQIVNLYDIPTSDYAIADVGGEPPGSSSSSGYFDWGLPFFYGRTVYVAIRGTSVGGQNGAYGY